MAPPRRPLPHPAAEVSRPVEGDDLDDRILDAALAEYMDFGMQRSSIDSVARRLGVDRRIVSQKFNEDSLAGAVMVREARRYLASVGQGIVGDTLSARLEEGFVAGVARRREQYILQALLDRDPVAAMAFLVGPDAGRLLEYAIKITRKAFRKAPDASGYTAASLDAAATAMIRLAHSMSNAPPDHEMDEHYLRSVARSVLLPILVPIGPARPGR